MAIKPKPLPPLVPIATPLDSMYGANMAGDQLSRNNQLAGLQRTGTMDQADTSEAIRRLAMQRSQQAQGYNANSARNGSLMSGRAMLGYGHMQTGFQQRGNDMQDAFARRAQGRSLQQQDVLGGASVYEQQQKAASGDRAATNAYNNRLPLYLAQQLAKKKV